MYIIIIKSQVNNDHVWILSKDGHFRLQVKTKKLNADAFVLKDLDTAQIVANFSFNMPYDVTKPMVVLIDDLPYL